MSKNPEDNALPEDLQNQLKKSIENMLKGMGLNVSDFKIGTPQLYISKDGEKPQPISREDYQKLEKEINENIKSIVKNMQGNFQINLPQTYQITPDGKLQNIASIFAPYNPKFNFPNIPPLLVQPQEESDFDVMDILEEEPKPEFFGPKHKISLEKEDEEYLSKINDKNTKDTLENLMKWRSYHTKTNKGIKEICNNFKDYKSFWTE